MGSVAIGSTIRIDTPVRNNRYYCRLSTCRDLTIQRGTKADLELFSSFECDRPLSNNATSPHLMESIQTDLLLTPLFPYSLKEIGIGPLETLREDTVAALWKQLQQVLVLLLVESLAFLNAM